jgi:hypothetical protein
MMWNKMKEYIYTILTFEAFGNSYGVGLAWFLHHWVPKEEQFRCERFPKQKKLEGCCEV